MARAESTSPSGHRLGIVITSESTPTPNQHHIGIDIDIVIPAKVGIS